jgi:MFS transporter, SP family, sugar:H+ symporter
MASLRLFYTCFNVSDLSVLCLGSYFTGVLGQTNFRQHFGDQRDPVTGAITGMSGSRESLLTSLIQAGEVIGCISASVLGDYGGRKGVFFAAASFVALGAILQLVTTGNVGVFATGRLLLGVGVGQVSSHTPT